MKTNLRQLLFCAAVAGLLPLSSAAQADNPPATEKSAPAVAAPAPSAPVSAEPSPTATASDTTATPAPVAATPSETASTAASTETTSAAAVSTPSPSPSESSASAAAPAAESTTTSEAPLRRLDNAPTALEAPTAPAEPSAQEPAKAPRIHSGRHGSGQNDRVAIGGNSYLGKDEVANSVVAVGGNATSEGEVRDSVVAVAGNARATGPVRDSVVAVMGNVYVDSKVGEVVAVLGNIELGPNAEVRGDVVPVLGQIKRDPNAVVHGNVQAVTIGALGEKIEWLKAYVTNCVLKGRPLAIAPNLGWAWGIALGFLLLYIVLALLFGHAIEKTAVTLETRPGGSILAALLTLLLTPVLIVLLCITVVGIAVVPFLAIGLMCATLFGKAVMLAWLGRRITRYFGDGPLAHPAFAVLIGGLIVLALYLVPFVGFIVYKLIGFVGLGTVVYTLVLASKREKRATPAPAYAMPTSDTVSGDPSAAGFATTGAAATAGVPAAAVVPPVVVASLPRAGFWIRIGALLIDVILVGIVCAVSGGFLPHFMHVQFPGLLVLIAIYGAVLWKLKGTTIGGIICGLRVVRTDGRELDWATVVVRALGCFLSLFVVGLGFIWIAIDEEKQSWHDKIAGTAVVHGHVASLV